MKQFILSSSVLSTLTLSAFAGAPMIAASASPDVFANAIAPISNATLADLALPRTKIHALYLHQQHPDSVNTTAGEVPVGGDLNIAALQLEYAFNNRLSFVANKDGYIDFNPNKSLPKQGGFANITAGLKYAFIYDEAQRFVLSGSALIEVPTGNRDVFQGYGDGAANLIVSTLKLKDAWQFSTSTGVQLPFDTDEQAITAFTSAHVSYQLTERFTPLVELNWFRVLSEGDGTGHQPVSAIAEFEGGDLINLGSANASTNKDIVTLAAGGRYKLTDALNIGAAYEIPLTDEQDNLMDSRITVDLVWKF